MSETTALYYFAIGGTGALSVEPLVHLCAAGLGPPSLRVVMIDADGASPSVERALEIVKQYQRVREAFGRPAQGFFRTDIHPVRQELVHWSPIGKENPGADGGNTTLAAYVTETRMAGSLADVRLLFDLLYSEQQQGEALREGFRGNPAIGSILLNGLKDAALMADIRKGAEGDTAKAFFATGSIFGGTGAAGLPVIANLLHPERDESEPDGAWKQRQAGFRARMGAALVTPYFSLRPAPNDATTRGRLHPDSSSFLRNTRAALPTYVRGRTGYGSIYVIGDSRSLPHQRRLYSAGGKEQRNDPHAVELYAALAALHFAAKRPAAVEEPVFQYTRVTGLAPGWSDVPLEGRARLELQSLLVASNFFLQYFGATRDDVAERALIRELNTLPWPGHVELGAGFVREHREALNTLGAYFAELWGYLFALQNAPTAQQTRMALVRFGDGGGTRASTPARYPFSDPEPAFTLPAVDATLPGLGEAVALRQNVDFFRWFNRVRDRDPRGIAGFLHYLHAASVDYVRDNTRGTS
ncbi:MAG TPA: hypothetical protein VFJ82_20945 [Longimicrobium sp.]|nr:hypothetical protein [Longimicrobium sp.]